MNFQTWLDRLKNTSSAREAAKCVATEYDGALMAMLSESITVDRWQHYISNTMVLKLVWVRLLPPAIVSLPARLPGMELIK